MESASELILASNSTCNAHILETLSWPHIMTNLWIHVCIGIGQAVLMHLEMLGEYELRLPFCRKMRSWYETYGFQDFWRII